MNIPVTRRTGIQTGDRSPSAPHQLSPDPNAIGAQISASAAGLKMCSRSVRRTRLLMIAKLLVQATTSQDSRDDRMKKTIIALNSALIGKRTRRAAIDIHTPSIRHAGTMAATRLVARLVPPPDGAAIANRIAKLTSSCAFGVLTKRATAVTG